MPQPHLHAFAETLVHREVSFPVSAFDWMKDYQRAYDARHGTRTTNSQILAAILADHRQSVVRGEVAADLAGFLSGGRR